jgi:hypothetical protein
MKRTDFIPQPIAIIICAALVVPLLPKATFAGDTIERVQVKLGKPSVWSLAQAHYLLASMHKKNSKIGLDDIKAADIDPNAANATRLQILRTVLGIQAEFNQKVGAENQSKLREEQFKVKRRADAQVELAAKEEELRAERTELNGLKRRLAVMQETDRQREEEREAQSQAESTRDETDKITIKKFIPLTDEDQKRKTDIAKLQQKVAAQQANVDGLNGEVTALNTQANGDVTPLALTDTSLTPNTIALPTASTTSMQKLIDNALSKSGKPSLAASIALDNYIGMQYEIIAKQLTLLRDEVGPDQRVIFLELPSSIYTVPCKSEDYVVQVHWKVNDYFKDSGIKDQDIDELKPIPRTAFDDMVEEFKAYVQKLTLSRQTSSLQTPSSKQARSNDNESLDTLVKPASTRDDRTQLRGVWKRFDDSNQTRAIDIIPRQSALNINDFHATVSQKNFLGVLKLLSGFGIKVDYQRQRELYEEFLQQEVFASGFGKGRQDFGWTFGPLPGTNRIAPGQRATYAVLAIPRDASALNLVGNAIAYKRTKTPMTEFPDFPDQAKVGTGQLIAHGNFVVSVPNERTEGFDVRSIAYTPVHCGAPLTAVIGGEYFSPQINVFVENTPLTRVLNFGSGEKKELTTLENTSKIKGFFELVNSKQLVLTFDMGDPDFVGTPNITLVTPEKTSSINFYPLVVNYHQGFLGYRRVSLRNICVTEPMFMKPFGLTAVEITSDGSYFKARLTGTGLRRKATIWVNDNQITNVIDSDARTPTSGEYARHESTTAYEVRFNKGDATTWNFRYKQQNVRGFDEATISKAFPPERKPFEIRHYTANGNGPAEVDLRFFNTVPPLPEVYKGKKIERVTVSRVEINRNEGTYPREQGCVVPTHGGQGALCGQFQEDEKKYRARLSIFPHTVGSHKLDRDTITVRVQKEVRIEVSATSSVTITTQEVMDISLPIRPQISRVINPGTGKPSGYADQEVTAIIEGVNLSAIKKIFFGSQEAEIVGLTDNDSAIVKVPKLATLPKGESATVPITVEMKSEHYEGKSLTAGYYRYIGEPVAIDVGEPVPVVVRPPRYKRNQKNGKD